MIRDLIQDEDARVDIPTMLSAIKERLVEYRFNIDSFDIRDGTLKGRRNSLDKMVTGLYRNVRVSVERITKDKGLSIHIEWGGLLFSNLLTFALIMLISYAILKGEGPIAWAYSVVPAILFVFLNIALFYMMRSKILALIKEDVKDLDKAKKGPRVKFK